MNQRIKELAEQAQIWIADYHGQRWEIDPKKFAELIIQECLNQCYNRGMNDELYAGQLKAAAYIEQHFGIKN